MPWRKKLNPWWWWQNVDDPEPPTWFNAHQREWERRLWWYLRNPLHNFHWYVIGKADHSFWLYGIRPEQNWVEPPGRWNWFVAFVYGWLPLPFVSYNGSSVEWHLGWKGVGNFGAALRRTGTTP